MPSKYSLVMCLLVCLVSRSFGLSPFQAFCYFWCGYLVATGMIYLIENGDE